MRLCQNIALYNFIKLYKLSFNTALCYSKKMKLLFYFIFPLFICPANAQNLEVVNLRIHYTAMFKKWETASHISQDEKILDVGKNISKFYSLWETRNEEIKDSILKLGGSFQDVQKALQASPYPRSYQYYAIYKNYPQKGLLTYTDKEFKEYIYEETLERPKWEVSTEEECTIAGYQCQKAQTKFRGRTWYAWFTIDIPISDGPWKLCGLPGLILKAEDAKGDFLFECIQIENKDKEVITLPKHKYIKCTREKLKQIKIQIGKDPNGYLKQLGYDSGEGHGMNGKSLKYNKTPVLLEY